MKLLLDANLSWRITSILKQHFTDCLHVDHIDVLAVPAKDIDIWNYAAKYNFIIVTNDEDFLDLINFKGFPPKIVLLKTGNQSRIFISNLLIARRKDIENLYQSKDTGVLEIVSFK